MAPPLSIDDQNFNGPQQEHERPHVLPHDSSGGAVAVHVNADNVTYHEDHILSKYVYENAIVSKQEGKVVVIPTKTQYEFKTETKVPRVGYKTLPPNSFDISNAVIVS